MSSKREKANMNDDDDDEDDEQTFFLLLLSNSNDTSKEEVCFFVFSLSLSLLIDYLNEYPDNFLFWKTDYESK